MKNCKYCNKELNSEDTYCSDECKANAELYFKKWEKYKFIYGVIIISSLIFIVGQVIFLPKLTMVSKALLIIMGATSFVFPFANTTDSLGLKKTVRIVRVLSVLLIVLAIGFLVFDS